MKRCCDQPLPPPPKAGLTIAVAGNPNCGKSALFNALTGIRQQTGNWPGVTVERKAGQFQLAGTAVTLVDLPGIYSLDATSLDEKVSRDYLLSREAELVINVVDASNLERNLYFTVQLLEMGVPLVLALNMMDVAERRGLELDTDRLSRLLGCPVVPIVAVRGQGLEALRQAVAEVLAGQRQGGFPLAQPEPVEQVVDEIAAGLGGVPDINRKWLALKLLEGDGLAGLPPPAEVLHQLTGFRQQVEARSGEPADMLIADTRYSHAHSIAGTTLTRRAGGGTTLSDRIDRLVLNRWLGVPVFLALMYLMFVFTMHVGGAFIDFFDQSAGALLVDGPSHWLSAAGAPAWLVTLVAGAGSGVQVVATFIPIIAALYLFLSALEDSGYMARAAFVMDRFMRWLGLPGKAFVPLIVGFGCNVPAVMASRTLEHERERRLGILMIPFMSCGARLPVYALFAAAFFPENGQNLVFALYLTGIVLAILTGLMMRHSLLPGEGTGFMLELPAYHTPSLRGVLLRAWDRVRVFVREAGRVIVVMVLGLTLVNSVSVDGEFGNQDPERSVLAAAARQLTPLFAPLGVQSDNWPAVVGLVSGVLAKEVVVGTLDNLYGSLAEQEAGAIDEAPFALGDSLAEAIKTIPQNLGQLAAGLLDPLGLDIEGVVGEQAVDGAVFGAMVARFDGQAGAFAFLLFVLLYMPCVATLGAIRRETGGRWAVFVALWSTGVAYITATLFYQAATLVRHPTPSLIWIGLLLAVLVVVVLSLRLWAQRERTVAA